MTVASKATKALPTAGPNSRVPAKVKVSEIEILALVPGSFIASHPLPNVRAARGSHLRWKESSRLARSTALAARTAAPNAKTTET
jgi:hypothetical protein